MPTGRRASAEQAARRVNAAARLLAAGADVAGAARQLAREHGLSERQARRYVQRARREGEIQVPETRVVFTVTLPARLASKVRAAAQARGQTISALVTRVLTQALDDEPAEQGDARAPRRG